MLVCGNCGSKFTIRNPRSYACASWINGKACSNRLQVRRDLVERLLLAQVKEDLSDPAIVAHVEKELRRRLKVRKPKTDPARRELEREIDNLVAAIATGALRSSPALAPARGRALCGNRRRRSVRSARLDLVGVHSKRLVVDTLPHDLPAVVDRRPSGFVDERCAREPWERDRLALFPEHESL